MTGITVELLDLGGLRGDASWFYRDANVGTVDDPSPDHAWADLRIYAGLIRHPQAGVLLYEAGGPPRPETDWAGEFSRSFPWTREKDERLDAALARAGHGLDDVRGIIVGHLHADHAGGIGWFRDLDVPLYVHEEELKNAFYGVATGEDTSFDHPYLDTHLDWRPVSGSHVELFPGITLIHLPGHTPGLVGALVELDASAPLLFVSDQLIFEDHLEGRVQGALNRDARAWQASLREVRRIQRIHGARIVFGHDPRNAERFPGTLR